MAVRRGGTTVQPRTCPGGVPGALWWWRRRAGTHCDAAPAGAACWRVDRARSPGQARCAGQPWRRRRDSSGGGGVSVAEAAGAEAELASRSLQQAEAELEAAERLGPRSRLVRRRSWRRLCGTAVAAAAVACRGLRHVCRTSARDETAPASRSLQQNLRPLWPAGTPHRRGLPSRSPWGAPGLGNVPVPARAGLAQHCRVCCLRRAGGCGQVRTPLQVVRTAAVRPLRAGRRGVCRWSA